MPPLRQLFLNHVAQTSPFPMIIEVDRAEGIFIFDVEGKRYFDMDSGFSVSSLGHRHPFILKAITQQLEKYMHTTVYGEHIQMPQVQYATKLSKILNNGLDTVYFANSGSEAVEIAIKTSRKYTSRYEIISCSNAYHGSTLGAESLRSDINYTSAFMPGLPGVRHIDFNEESQLDNITEATAAIILEAVQAEAGIISPNKNYLTKVRDRCYETGTLMILDEIQTGFGRTGNLFAFQKYGVVPDMVLMAKAMGGGMPVGAALAPNNILACLADKPSLGHITTFGGHPVCIAAANATLDILQSSNLISEVTVKEKLFHQLLVHPHIKELRSDGLLMALELKEKALLSKLVSALKEEGVIVDYFLFNDNSFRIAPPLVISTEEIHEVCDIILKVLDKN